MLYIVGNYPPDRQWSMLAYQNFLHERLTRSQEPHRLLMPRQMFRRSRLKRSVVLKWLGYLDKYVLFPMWLHILFFARRDEAPRVFHITDHSNSVYASALRRYGKVVVTCHDMLAVRGALGEDTDCPATAFGRLLQRHVLRGLDSADLVLCASNATASDFVRLSQDGRPRGLAVLPMPLNADFQCLGQGDVQAHLRHCAASLVGRPYILHVGSDLVRKNRDGVIRAFALARSEGWPGLLCFAGATLNKAEVTQAEAEGLVVGKQIIVVERPSHGCLVALYSGAHCLLFPSRHEGFGWPVIEAQACNCPVVTVKTTSLPEVAGRGALLLAIHDEQGMARAVLALDNVTIREQLIEAGRRNVLRFDPDAYMTDYRRLLQELT